MAQTIKLKRTAVQGKTPTTSNLDLGELAINTYDGRIFFEKDVDGILSIQEILTTDSDVTGSLNLNGAITASYINANGSGNSILVGDTLRIEENGSGLRMTNVGAFDNSSGNFRIFATHDLILATNGENGTAVTIDKTTKDTNFVGAITASSLQISGDTIIDGNLTLGGNITIGDSDTDTIVVAADFSGSIISDGNELYDLGSSVKKWNNTYTKNLIATNITATSFTGSIAATNGIVSGSSQLTSSFDSRYLNVSGEGNISGSFTGSFIGDGSGLTGIQVDQIASITSSFSEQSTINVSHNFGTYNVIVSTYDSNYNQLIPQTVSLTDTNTVQVVLSSAHSGHIVVAKGGHILDTSELTSYRESVSGASFYNITHSLDEEYPFVQAWNTSNNTQEQPLDIESVNANIISVSFSANFTGKIIVKK